jgi:hypothetical protein
VSQGVPDRPPAAAGKDAGPQESFWDFKGRGRRQAAISGRRGDVMACRREHYNTSGASETIFMKPPSRSSRATGPKMRVPRGLFWASMITAAFSSKEM